MAEFSSFQFHSYNMRDAEYCLCMSNGTSVCNIAPFHNKEDDEGDEEEQLVEEIDVNSIDINLSLEVEININLFFGQIVNFSFLYKKLR